MVTEGVSEGDGALMSPISAQGDRDPFEDREDHARGYIQSLERAQQILRTCDDNVWMVIIGIEADKTENIVEVKRLLYPSEPKKVEQKVRRNAPCPCVSGKKFKKFCMAK